MQSKQTLRSSFSSSSVWISSCRASFCCVTGPSASLAACAAGTGPGCASSDALRCILPLFFKRLLMWYWMSSECRQPPPQKAGPQPTYSPLASASLCLSLPLTPPPACSEHESLWTHGKCSARLVSGDGARSIRSSVSQTASASAPWTAAAPLTLTTRAPWAACSPSRPLMPFPPSFDAADDEERLPLGFEAGLVGICPGDGRLLPSVVSAGGGKSAAPLAAELIMPCNRPPTTLQRIVCNL